jgi:tetratricopeptide (TPR) repeat protein
MKLDKRAEAETACRLALPIDERLAADFPAVPDHRSHLARDHYILGLRLTEFGKWTEAETAYRQALPIQEKLVAEFPDVPGYRVQLARSCVDLGILLYLREEVTAALDWWAKALPLLETVLAHDPSVAIARKFLRTAHWFRARTLLKRARFAEAVQEADRALAQESNRALALDDGPPALALRLFRSLALAAQTGDHARAAAEVEVINRDDKVSGDTLYAAACACALASTAMKEDAQRTEVYASQAVLLLRRARAADYFKDDRHIQALKTNPDFNGLWERADFEALMTQLNLPTRR